MRLFKHMSAAYGRLSKGIHIYDHPILAKMAAETEPFPVVVLDKESYDETIKALKRCALVLAGVDLGKKHLEDALEEARAVLVSQSQRDPLLSQGGSQQPES